MPSILPLFSILLLLLAHLTTVQACGNLNLTLETCTSSLDCIDNTALDGHQCFGRDDSTNDLKQCPDAGVSTCYCLPVEFRFCAKHTDCLDEQYCGVSPNSGNALCIGCLSLPDTNLNFAPIVPTNGGRCKGRTEHPPCGMIADFCSVTKPCHSDYTCVYRGRDANTLCGEYDSPCQCMPTESVQESLIPLSPCNSNADCTQSHETCAFATSLGSKTCVSCFTLRTSPFYLPSAETRAKCGGVPQRNPPSQYRAGPNGKTYDNCDGPSMCVGDRKCVQWLSGMDGLFEPPTGPCQGSSTNYCFCRPDELRACESPADCPEPGETCLNLPPAGIYGSCITVDLLLTVDARSAQVVGADEAVLPTPMPGKGLTADTCSFDWDCVGKRRCTFVGGVYGGCAGRRACTCEPLAYTMCRSSQDCTGGEVCIQTIGARSRPYCASPSVASLLSMYIREFPFNPAPGPPAVLFGSGLTWDSCLLSSDCQGDNRVCKHRTEALGECESRAGCICVNTAQNTCSQTSDCITGEACVNYRGASPSPPFCISRFAFEVEQGQRNSLWELKQPIGSAQSTVQREALVPHLPIMVLDKMTSHAAAGTTKKGLSKRPCLK